MDTETKTKTDWPATVGATIGNFLVMVTVALVASFVLSVAWNNGPARVAMLPDMSWADSLGTLVAIWILVSPIRRLRITLES
jgi:uncharacterized membrane protein YqhA